MKIVSLLVGSQAVYEAEEAVDLTMGTIRALRRGPVTCPQFRSHPLTIRRNFASKFECFSE
jgi:hypothetical protein